MGLSGKVALVTGGGTGIGKAIAEALAENGARVAVASRNPSHLQFAAGNPSFMAVAMDVRDKAQVQSGVAQIRESLGPVDILINNAGISGLTSMHDADDRRWRDIIETNLTGSYLVTKEVLKFMKNNAHGRIVNLSSVLGKFGVPGYAAYCSAKHGIIGFTRAVALEVVGRGITVNAICPGWVETDMARQGIEESAAFEGITPEAFRKRAVENVPIKRFLEADEVSGLVLYLVSEKAAGITGQAINICGGQTMV